jgi:serine/threonine-protein kinase
VFRAHDPVEGRLVAVKTFHLDLTPEAAAGLVGELQSLVAKDLTHPSIASPLAAGLSGATPWLAQAYVPAESLDGALRQYGPAPTAHVVTVVTHLAGALDFAAVSGVVHGSLHPRDVLVAPDETFLLDLGVAGALERCGLRPPVRRPYSAPERIAGARVSRPADIFALAAIAFELLSGRPIAGPDGASVATLPDVHGADTAELRRVLASLPRHSRRHWAPRASGPRPPSKHGAHTGSRPLHRSRSNRMRTRRPARPTHPSPNVS